MGTFDFFTSNRGVPRKKLRSTVNHDALDDGVLQDMTDKAELFQKTLNDVPTIEIDGKQKEVVNWTDGFIPDTFRSLHTMSDPGVAAPEDILPHLEPVRRVMQRFMGTEDFQAARPMTKHDEIASAFGTMRAAKKLEPLIQDAMGDMSELANQAEKQETRIERNEQKLEELRDQARQEHGTGDGVSKETQEAIDKAVKAKHSARHDLAKTQGKMADIPVTTGAQAVIEQAAEEARKGAEVVSSLPGVGKGTGAGENKKLNADEALKLAQMFADSPELFKIASMLGRIVRDMRFKRARRQTGGVEEVVDVMLGKDLPQVLPSQLMHARHPLLRKYFQMRFMQSALLQRERRGTTEAGRGPVVAVVDESYSMKGQPFVWAKALCMAIMAIGRKEKRDVAVVSYASDGDLEAWEFPFREPMDPAKVVEMASHNFGGGTETREAMKLAREIIDKDQRFTRADVVLITDGKDEWEEQNDPAVKQDFTERGIRIHGIQVGTQSRYTYMENMCDHMSNAQNLTGANEATDSLAANLN